MTKYGYMGTVPDQTASKNDGVFQLADQYELNRDGKWTKDLIDVEYLVIAGGGGAGTGSIAPGGGGSGGLRNSYATETSGGGGSTETPINLRPDGVTTYTVTVGGGGSTNNKGSNSVFSTVTSLGGGDGGTSNSTSSFSNGATGGSGGGGGWLASGASGTTNQVFAGGNGGNIDDGNRKGGHGGSASADADFNTGLDSSITGSAVTYAKGGRRGQTSSPTAGDVAVANTGNGGNAGGSGLTCRPGASGIVILRYPASASLTIGSGLTSTTTTSGDEKITSFTAGTDTIVFS